MKQITAFSPYKKILEANTHQSFRNTKSLKRLQSHLKQYKQTKSHLPLSSSLNLRKSQPKSTSNELTKQTSIFNGQNSPLLSTRNSIENTGDKKVQALVDSLLLNISIFNKVFSGAKRKKHIIQKIFGWDEIFNEVFFNKVDDENFKPNLSKRMIIQGLNLDKGTFATKNIINKLRFFLSELIDLNFRQQEAECKFQKQRFTESSSKLLQKLSALQNETERGVIRSQIQKMRNTHVDLFNRKMRIKNRGRQIQKIVTKTGQVNLDKFFLKEQSNIEEVEKFLKMSLIK